MHTGTLSVKNLFEQERRHVVPVYQRPYVWTKEAQWKPLWEDIAKIAERILAGEETPRPHFLGAIVLNYVRKPTGHVETRLVIDGQQRLTTVQLFLQAFCDFCAAASVDDYRKSIARFTRNDDPLSTDTDEQFKIWPTNVDRETFRRVMLAGSREAVAAAGIADQRIGQAYLFFSSAIERWMRQQEQGFEQRLEALFKAVREYTRLVVIDLGQEDDPQLIFETLNARGTPLLPADLIKNLLYYRAAAEGENADALYEQFWRPFDEDVSYWREELGRGHAKRARLDTFLQHYLTLKTGGEVSVTHLYAAFRDFVRQSGSDPAKTQLGSIRSYARTYRGFDEVEPGTGERVFFDRLSVMEITTAYPFLLELFHGAYDTETRRGILKDLESFLVRRLVCQLTTRGYNRFFIDMLSVLQRSRNRRPQEVRTFLFSSDSEAARWPADAEFQQHWLSSPLFTRLRRGRTRMLLEALERHAHTSKSERIEFGEKLTVEHLLPQEWRRHWPLPDPSPAHEFQRNRVIHTMGNLTLLTKALNPAVSNGPWLKKRAAILEHSGLALNRRLSRADEWDEKAIQRRGEELARLAIEVWPRPENGDIR